MKLAQIWIDQKNYLLTEHLLTEQSLDDGIEELSSKAGSVLLPPSNISIEGKKNWIRQFWDDNKGKIAIGALGAAAIAALYMSGISLVPFGINIGIDVLKKTVKGLNTDEILKQKPLLQAVISGYKKVFIKNVDKWIPIDYQELANMAANATPDQNGFRIKVIEAPDSRVTNLKNLLQSLKNAGLSDNEIMFQNELFSP